MCEEDIKAEEMIKDFWTGKEAENCDGDMFGFSNMAHILFEKQQKEKINKLTFFQNYTSNFKVNLKVDYTF